MGRGLDRNDLNVFFELVDETVAVGKVDEAIAFLKLATFYQPYISHLWVRLAEIYQLRSDFEAAADAYREAWRQNNYRLSEIDEQTAAHDHTYVFGRKTLLADAALQ